MKVHNLKIHLQNSINEKYFEKLYYFSSEDIKINTYFIFRYKQL